MDQLIDTLSRYPDVSEEDQAELRRGLLLLDREATRRKGQRKLERIAARNHRYLAPVALAGLAASAIWENDYPKALPWLQMAISRYPMSAASLWAATILVTVYRSLGMRRERFYAEGERFRLMKKIAFHSDVTEDRIFALLELLDELRARDRHADAERCEEELRDLGGLARRSRRASVRPRPAQ